MEETVIPRLGTILEVRPTDEGALILKADGDGGAYIIFLTGDAASPYLTQN